MEAATQGDPGGFGGRGKLRIGHGEAEVYRSHGRRVDICSEGDIRLFSRRIVQVRLSPPMFGASPPRLPQPVTLFLLPKFSMMGFASAVEPLRSANRMSGRALYTWHILSKDGGPVTASNGIPVVPEAGIEKTERCETLILCGGLDVHLYRDKGVFAWLRRLDRQGADLDGQPRARPRRPPRRLSLHHPLGGPRRLPRGVPEHRGHDRAVRNRPQP